MERNSQETREQRKVIAQKAIIKKDDRFLVLKRSDDASRFPGLWDFPGGRLEEGENPVDGLIREVKEEVGFIIRPDHTLQRIEYSDTNGPVEFIIYAVELVDGNPENPTIGTEHSSFQLMTREEIRTLPTMPYMQKFLELSG